MATPMTDADSLVFYASTRSPQALEDLVRRYLDLVYSTARRLVGESQADDVTQATFLVLLKKADRLDARTLPGWFVNTTRLAAKEALRSHATRSKHETRAATMRHDTQSTADEPTADQLLPLLDEALAKLTEPDRTVVVLRFLQGQTFAEVGTATGTTEEAARKRVGRAVEKLRAIFMKQGVAPSVGGVMIVLAAQQGQAAPAAVAAGITTSMATGGTATSAMLAKGAASAMTLAKAKIVALAIIAAGIAGTASVEVVRRSMTEPPVVKQTQTTQPAPAMPTVAAAIPGPQNPAGMIRPGDVIEINVAGLLSPSGATPFTLRVDPAGLVAAPLVPPMKVDGLTTDVAASLISKSYNDARLISNGVVTIAIRQSASPDSNIPGPIAAGDSLQIGAALFETPGQWTTVDVVVADNGTVNVPKLSAIKVAGLTEAQAAAAISKVYGNTRVPPPVTVFRTLAAGQPVQSRLTPPPEPATHPAVQLQPGDVVEIAVDDLVGIGIRSIMPVRIDAAGNARVLIIGPVHLAGMDGKAAAARIAKGYSDAKLMEHATVEVALRSTEKELGFGTGPFGAGDTLEVRISDLVGMATDTIVHAQVSPAGTIELPLIGPLQIAGTTETQTADAIVRIFSQKRIIEKAGVTVLRTAVPGAVPSNAAAFYLRVNGLITVDSPNNSSIEILRAFPPFGDEWNRLAKQSWEINQPAIKLAREARQIQDPAWPAAGPTEGQYLNACRSVANVLADAATYQHLQGNDAEAVELSLDILKMGDLLAAKADNSLVRTLTAVGIRALGASRVNVICSGAQFTADPANTAAVQTKAARELIPQLLKQRIPNEEIDRIGKQAGSPKKLKNTKNLSLAVETVNRVNVEQAFAAMSLAGHLYRLDKGRWPSSLDDLVPAYLPQPTIDPWGNGKQMLGYILIKAGLPDGSDRPMVYSRCGSQDGLFYRVDQPTYMFYADDGSGQPVKLQKHGGQFRDLARWEPRAGSKPNPTTRPLP